jgi:hypothetical protein
VKARTSVYDFTGDTGDPIVAWSAVPVRIEADSSEQAAERMREAGQKILDTLAADPHVRVVDGHEAVVALDVTLEAVRRDLEGRARRAARDQ